MPTATPSAASADPTLRWAIDEPTSIIPLNATSSADLLVVDALFDSLTRWDEAGTPLPAAAVRWTAFDGGRRWRFFLRQSAAFHDGTPVTAEHFVRTWTSLATRGEAHHHLRDVAGYRRVRAGADVLNGVSALGDHTLEVKLSRPMAEFPSVVAHPALAPMLRPESLDATSLDRPVGNGPFSMAEPWAHGRFVRLTRARDLRPAADGAGAPLYEVVFQIHDPASAYIAYEQGGVDVATVPAGALQADQPPARPVTRYRGPGLLRGDLPTTYLLTMSAAAPFDDIRVRRGISLALDRERIADTAFEGAAAPARTVFPRAAPGGRLRACRWCVHDPPAARRLLAAAGLSAVTLWISEGGEHEQVAAQVRRDLAAAGLAVRVRAVPFERFLGALRSGRPGLFRFGWALDYPTGDNALRPLFHSASLPASGGVNFTTYDDDLVDRLLDRGARATDPGRRIDAYRRAEDIILNRDQAVIPVASLRRRTVVADRIRGLTYGPMGAVDLLAVRVVERGEP